MSYFMDLVVAAERRRVITRSIGLARALAYLMLGAALITGLDISVVLGSWLIVQGLEFIALETLEMSSV